MAIEFTNKPTKWENDGAEPATELKKNGFQAGYKPPAGIFNHHWSESARCIEELQSKLSDTDDKKVDKVDGKELINSTFASNVDKKSIYFESDSGDGKSISITPQKIYLSTPDGAGITIEKEKIHMSDISDWYNTDIEATGITSTDTKGNRLNIFSSDIILKKVNTDDNSVITHTLSEKANSADVLVKTNTTEFTPTGDYNPATKKYVDDKVGSITVPIIDNLESDSTTSALSAKQGKVLDAAIAAKVDKVSGKGLSANDFTDTYKSKLDNLDTNLSAKAAKTEVLTKTNTTAFTPTANYHPATKKYVDDNTKTKVINGSDLSSLTLTVSSTIPTTLAAGTICFIPEA